MILYQPKYKNKQIKEKDGKIKRKARPKIEVVMVCSNSQPHQLIFVVGLGWVLVDKLGLVTEISLLYQNT